MYCDFCLVGSNCKLIYQTPSGQEGGKWLPKWFGPVLVLHCPKLSVGHEYCYCSFFWTLYMIIPLLCLDIPAGGVEYKIQGMFVKMRNVATDSSDQ